MRKHGDSLRSSLRRDAGCRAVFNIRWQPRPRRCCRDPSHVSLKVAASFLAGVVGDPERTAEKGRALVSGAVRIQIQRYIAGEISCALISTI